MAESPGLTPVEYIDRFFDELREEVRANPKLAARLVKALGGNVVFENEAKAEAANPYALAAEGDKVRFLSVFGSMKAGEIKKVLKDNNLATRVDMTGKSVEQLVDMLYTRAARKVGERKSSAYKTQCQQALAPNGRYISIDDGSPKDDLDDLLLIRNLLEAGKFIAVIDRCYPLDQIVEAHRYVDTGHKRGNVIITMV